GEDESIVLTEHGLETLQLEAPETGLPVEIEHQIQRQAALLFDQAIELDKGNPQPARQRGAHCGFASAAKTNQRDAFQAADGIDFAELLEQELSRRLHLLWGEAAEKLDDVRELDRRLVPLEQQ